MDDKDVRVVDDGATDEATASAQPGETDLIDPRWAKTYTRFNSPFWQVVIVSLAAFG